MSELRNTELRRKPEQERARQSLDAIRDSAIDLLGSKGSDGFSMSELAREAGLSKAALYRYFPNKQAILVELARAAFEGNRQQLAVGMDPAPGEEIESFKQALTAYCDLQRSESYRRYLRAAIHADPAMAALDVEDSRHNAEHLSAMLIARYPRLEKNLVRMRMLLMVGAADSVANMASQFNQAEAEQLISGFVETCTAGLL